MFTAINLKFIASKCSTISLQSLDPSEIFSEQKLRRGQELICCEKNRIKYNRRKFRLARIFSRNRGVATIVQKRTGLRKWRTRVREKLPTFVSNWLHFCQTKIDTNFKWTSWMNEEPEMQSELNCNFISLRNVLRDLFFFERCLVLFGVT